MSFRRPVLLPMALLLLLAAHATASEPRTIEIRVEGTPRFDVFYHRALSNVVGAAFGGLIGAGIQSGIESDKDAKKRKALSPYVSEHVWNDVFVKTLDEALRAKGFEPVWVGAKAKGGAADAYLTLFPDSYGFRIVDSTTVLVSAYAQLEAVYGLRPIKRDARVPRERFYLTEEKQAPYEQLLVQAQTLDAQVVSVLDRTARRLANKVIYNIK